MEVEEPSRISFWDSHQSDPDAICDPKKIRAINYKMAILITILAVLVFAVGSTLNWSEEVVVRGVGKVVRQSGYVLFLYAAGSVMMGFSMGYYWKRPYLALPLVWILGVPSVLIGNLCSEQIFEGAFTWPYVWRAVWDIFLGPFIASVASLVSLSMYRFD